MKYDEMKRHRPDIIVVGEGKALAYMPEDPMGVWCHIQDVNDLIAKKDEEIESLKASHYAEMVDAGMSELKAVYATDKDSVTSLYYPKSEADKVITELKMKLASAQMVLRLNKPEALFSDLEIMGRLKHQIYVVARRERHQKYKRCLAMAKACHEKGERMYCEASVAKAQNEIIGKEPKDAVVKKFELWGAIASTHRKRWLKLAEQFKPNN